MTTKKATIIGKASQRATKRLANKSMTAGEYQKHMQATSFKDVSVFTTIFGEDWDLIHRIATDPAHELYNLVKDLLGLMCNSGSMQFKAKYWELEKKLGRFGNLKTHYGAPVAPWHISTQRKQILTSLIDSGLFKGCDGWPKTISYFSDEYEKIKIAESMAFCGDRGKYFMGLTDIDDQFKLDFMELLKVADGLLAKTSTGA